MRRVHFTIDLEDPSGAYASDGRYVRVTHQVLDVCDKLKRRATFFTVGRIATAAPDLVRAIVERGHEIAYHSHAHLPLTKDTPDNFRRESREDKDRLEQLAGKTVVGFRAPAFSLMPETKWAIDVIGELGFRYSASVMPTRISRFGFPQASRTPFRWPNGVIELPLPVASRLRLPYLGGIYLYALPFPLVQAWLNQADSDECLWTYAHPYDFDIEEPFSPIVHTPAWGSWILHKARAQAVVKIPRLLALTEGTTLSEVIADV